jgi:hypothetical protein
VIDLDGFARLAVGAADAADRAEMDGDTREAEALRELAEAVEGFLVRMAPPVAPSWVARPAPRRNRAGSGC